MLTYTEESSLQLYQPVVFHSESTDLAYLHLYQQTRLAAPARLLLSAHSTKLENKFHQFLSITDLPHGVLFGLLPLIGLCKLQPWWKCCIQINTTMCSPGCFFFLFSLIFIQSFQNFEKCLGCLWLDHSCGFGLHLTCLSCPPIELLFLGVV